jgi:hypothetical protein
MRIVKFDKRDFIAGNFFDYERVFILMIRTPFFKVRRKYFGQSFLTEI